MGYYSNIHLAWQEHCGRGGRESLNHFARRWERDEMLRHIKVLQSDIAVAQHTLESDVEERYKVAAQAYIEAQQKYLEIATRELEALGELSKALGVV